MSITFITSHAAPAGVLLHPDLGRPTVWAVVAGVGAIALLVVAAVWVDAYLRSTLRRRQARRVRLERQWSHLLQSVLAGERPQDALLQCVDRRDRLDFVDFLARFARRSRGDHRAVLPQLARRYLPEIAEHTRGGTPERRARALDTLALLDFHEYEPEIVAGLDDPAWLVAAVAARILCHEQRVQHVEAVIAMVERFDHPSPRYLPSLVAAAGPHAAPALQRVLADPNRAASSRAVAAEALRAFQDPEPAVADPSPWVAIHMLRTLQGSRRAASPAAMEYAAG